MDMDNDIDIDIDMDEEFDLATAGSLGIFGTPLVEVLNVSIDKKIDVYGTFSVEDENGSLYFYRRTLEDIESVKAKSTLLSLTTPPRIIPAAGTITFNLDLKDEHHKEFIKGSFKMDLMNENISECLDKYLVATVNGELGSARIYYTIPIVALGATIRFQLLKVNNAGGLLDINGRIIARYGDNYDDIFVGENEKQYTQFVLYEKTSKDKSSQLKVEDVLPLLRPLVIVPSRCPVVIGMNLEFRQPDGQIEPLELEFQVPPSVYGSHIEIINLNSCVLEAKVYFQDEIGLS